MEQPIKTQETTLNSNIAKELIWRRNAPYFYQSLYTQQLQWPSLTVEWWVDQFAPSNTKVNDQTSLCYLTYGTHTSGEEKNYLIMAKVYVPNQNYIRKLYRDKAIKANEAIKKNDNSMDDKIVIQHEVEHDGEVNRIKHHPKKTNLIATRTPLGEIHLFNKTKFKTGGRVKVNPEIIMIGHETEGYAIEWNPHKEGYIVAGSYDGKLTLWDISSKQETNRINPLCYFNHHEKQIQDISHNQFHDCIFGSCDDEGQVVLWDTRNSRQPIHHFNANGTALYSMQFSPLNRHIFATGGEEKIIKLWDVRNMSEPVVAVKESNNQQINQLKWSFEERQTLWSVAGNNMTMWDMSECKPKFTHAGHMQKVNQMDIHPTEPQTIASVDDNNEIHVFQPTRNASI